MIPGGSLGSIFNRNNNKKRRWMHFGNEFGDIDTIFAENESLIQDKMEGQILEIENIKK